MYKIKFVCLSSVTSAEIKLYFRTCSFLIGLCPIKVQAKEDEASQDRKTQSLLSPRGQHTGLSHCS